MERIAKELRKRDKLEPGEDLALVFDDAVVLVSMTEGRELKINVVLGYERIEGDAFSDEEAVSLWPWHTNPTIT